MSKRSFIILIIIILGAIFLIFNFDSKRGDQDISWTYGSSGLVTISKPGGEKQTIKLQRYLFNDGVPSNPETATSVSQSFILKNQHVILLLISKDWLVGARVGAFVLLKVDWKSGEVASLIDHLPNGNVYGMLVSPQEKFAAYRATWGLNACSISDHLAIVDLQGENSTEVTVPPTENIGRSSSASTNVLFDNYQWKSSYVIEFSRYVSNCSTNEKLGSIEIWQYNIQTKQYKQIN